MDTTSPQQPPIPPPAEKPVEDGDAGDDFLSYNVPVVSASAQFFADYFWFILKNFIGWFLIIAAWPVGLAVPGPGGIPIFLLGFALVTFPGKRALTARVLRGRVMDLQTRRMFIVTACLSVILGALGLWYVTSKWGSSIYAWRFYPLILIVMYLLLAAVSWLVVRGSMRGINVVLRGVPRARRKVRPWLRKKGIHLLPPRRRQRLRADLTQETEPDVEILEIHERHHTRIRTIWAFLKPWLKRIATLVVIVLSFFYILKPVARLWPEILGEIRLLNIVRFTVAAGMLGVFYLLFRALLWRAILIKLRHPIPPQVAARIWSAAELAHYLPGANWDVISRHATELGIFAMANVLICGSCMVILGTNEGYGYFWAIGILVLLLSLITVLVPKTFYRLVNTVLRLAGLPRVRDQRLKPFTLFAMVAWATFGMLFQGIALWLLMEQKHALNLPLEDMWIVLGTYCLAWLAGFAAAWAPGGIGVRELMFAIALRFALPESLKDVFVSDYDKFLALVAVSIVLARLCTIAGQLMLAGVSYIVDYRGVLGWYYTATKSR
jgi:hypothetical protein